MHEGKTSQRPFPTTEWSLIVRAGAEDPVERAKALTEICTHYWPPVYAFIRSQGYSPHDAEDLTQAFFGELLKRDDFAKADASRGRLRNYLLAAAKNQLHSARRDGRRLKRGGGVPVLSIDARDAEGRCLIPEPIDHFSPEKVFDRQWAITVLEQVVNALAARYEAKGQTRLFEALRPFITPTGCAPPQSQLARDLGMSDQALRVAIHRLRQRYGELLRETVRATLGREESVEEEIRHLLASFS